mmetsp:Transcript_23441/g.76188  ORF Transcript_23441/g.76188 Transcript_23441/m.76188 type:complete len:215 (-) Transcript_23441:856-1500(-)
MHRPWRDRHELHPLPRYPPRADQRFYIDLLFEGECRKAHIPEACCLQQAFHVSSLLFFPRKAQHKHLHVERMLHLVEREVSSQVPVRVDHRIFRVLQHVRKGRAFTFVVVIAASVVQLTLTRHVLTEQLHLGRERSFPALPLRLLPFNAHFPHHLLHMRRLVCVLVWQRIRTTQNDPQLVAARPCLDLMSIDDLSSQQLLCQLPSVLSCISRCF